MSVDHLYFMWAVSPEGDPWVLHWCTPPKVERYRLPSPWHVTIGGSITPSLICDECGRHVILGTADSVTWGELHHVAAQRGAE